MKNFTKAMLLIFMLIQINPVQAGPELSTSAKALIAAALVLNNIAGGVLAATAAQVKNQNEEFCWIGRVTPGNSPTMLIEKQNEEYGGWFIAALGELLGIF